MAGWLPSQVMAPTACALARLGAAGGELGRGVVVAAPGAGGSGAVLAAWAVAIILLGAVPMAAARASPSAYPHWQLESVAGAWTAAQAMCVTSPQEFSG